MLGEWGREKLSGETPTSQLAVYREERGCRPSGEKARVEQLFRAIIYTAEQRGRRAWPQNLHYSFETAHNIGYSVQSNPAITKPPRKAKKFALREFCCR